MSKLSANENTIEAFFRKGFELAEAGKIDDAIAAYLVAARLGSADAQANLGTLLDDHAVPPRPKEAVFWYKKGVRADDNVCAWNLAMHYSGLGQRRWYLHWLRVASKMGHPDADNELRTAEWWEKRNAR